MVIQNQQNKALSVQIVLMCLQELIHESLAILHRNKMVSIDHHRWLDQPLLNSQHGGQATVFWCETKYH